MRRVYFLIGFTIALCVLVTGICIKFTYFMPQDNSQHVFVRPGDSAYKVALKLTKNATEKWLCLGMIFLTGHHRDLKAGDYIFPKDMTRAEQIRALVARSHQVIYKFKVIEGQPVSEVMRNLAIAPAMEGHIEMPPTEGLIYPDTYHYHWGENRQTFLQRMHRKMFQALEKTWQERQENPLLHTPQELLTLASIIEKESACSEERPHIAAVFYNRLKRKMRLQSDPTVIYGITKGEKLNRDLTKADLETPHEYNTYVHFGLPPGPICIPSISALQAVAHPIASNALYFVADGTGKHVFANNLSDHQKHHQQWRRIKNARPSHLNTNNKMQNQ